MINAKENAINVGSTKWENIVLMSLHKPSPINSFLHDIPGFTNTGAVVPPPPPVSEVI